MVGGKIIPRKFTNRLDNYMKIDNLPLSLSLSLYMKS